MGGSAILELEGFVKGWEGEGAAQQEEGLLLLRQSLGTLEKTMVVEGGPGLVVGWRGGESVVAEEDGGGDTETEEELNSEGEEVRQEWHPDRGNLNLEMTVQYEQALRLQRLEEEGKAAAQGQGRSSQHVDKQQGEDMTEVGCKGGSVWSAMLGGRGH